MTTRHLHNEARGYHLDGNGERGTDDRAPSKLEAAQRSAPLTVRKAGRMNVAEKRPLPCPSDWTFELIEEYDTEDRARRRALRARHLSDPARTHQRRADDGRLRVGRHAGELPALVVRQAFHRHREELPARPDGPRVRDRHQFESLHRVPDGREHDDDAGARHRARRLRPQLVLQGQLPVPPVDGRARDHRLPRLREELHRRVRGAPRARRGRGTARFAAMR